MAVRPFPYPGGPRDTRELYHWFYRELERLHKRIDEEGGGPPPEVSDADVGVLMAAAAGAGLTFLPPDEGGAA